MRRPPGRNSQVDIGASTDYFRVMIFSQGGTVLFRAGYQRQQPSGDHREKFPSGFGRTGIQSEKHCGSTQAKKKPITIGG